MEMYPSLKTMIAFFSVNIHTFMMLTVKVNAAIYSMRTAFIQEYYSALKKKKKVHVDRGKKLVETEDNVFLCIT